MPTRTDEIRSWLEGVWDGARFSLRPASSDASFRRYLRAERDGSSYIVMDAPPDREDCRAFHAIAGRLAAAGLNVPRVFAANHDRGLLLLSDLGQEHYLDRLAPDSVEKLYADAFEALAEMQTRTATDGLPAYDRVLLSREMALFQEWFLGAHLGIELTPERAAVLSDAFGWLCESAAEQPRVFVHRDYHSRNLLVHAANPGILDFQDAVIGPVTYDLVSLLRDVYVRWPRPRVESWALRYRDIALERGILPATSRERFLRWFDLMGVQRHLKVAGIFARLYRRDGKPGYLNDLPLTLRYLQEVAADYHELSGLGSLLDELAVTRRVEAARR